MKVVTVNTSAGTCHFLSTELLPQFRDMRHVGVTGNRWTATVSRWLGSNESDMFLPHYLCISDFPSVYHLLWS